MQPIIMLDQVRRTQRLVQCLGYTLVAGDNVYIHYRITPYKEKILVSGRGTAGQWIRVSGVLGPNGERPIIDGDSATTGPNMHFA